MITTHNRTTGAYQCPVCDSTDVRECIRVADIPIYCNVTYQSKETAENAALGAIDLAFCCRCSHLFNSAFETALIDYRVEYENALHHSAHFLSYADTLSDDLILQYNLRGKNLVEIGSGPGHFLALLCDKGNNCGIGFDPSYLEKKSDENISRRVKILSGHFRLEQNHPAIDLLCCRHVLEHVHQPIPLLREIHTKLRESIPVYFEVPNAMYTLSDLGIWDLIYEHCGYFTDLSIRHAFERSGYSVTKVDQSFGNQFLGMHARKEQNQGTKDFEMHVPDEPLTHITKLMMNFREQYWLKVEYWKDTLDFMQSRGETAAVWGAGSKGVSFCNIMGQFSCISYLIDINPNKQGRHIAGTGHRICAPEHLLQQSVDVIIVLNSLYTSEVQIQLEQLGVCLKILEDKPRSNHPNSHDWPQ